MYHILKYINYLCLDIYVRYILQFRKDFGETETNTANHLFIDDYLQFLLLFKLVTQITPEKICTTHDDLSETYRQFIHITRTSLFIYSFLLVVLILLQSASDIFFRLILFLGTCGGPSFIWVVSSYPHYSVFFFIFKWPIQYIYLCVVHSLVFSILHLVLLIISLSVILRFG